MGTVCEVGNMTRDPELRYTPSGQAVVNFGIAVDQSYKNRQGEKVEQVSFFEVTAWGSLAENAAESLHKGLRVTVVGRLKSESWEDKETHQKRSKVVISADSIGPDLRWATCAVTKAERSNAGGDWNGQ